MYYNSLMLFAATQLSLFSIVLRHLVFHCCFIFCTFEDQESNTHHKSIIQQVQKELSEASSDIQSDLTNEYVGSECIKFLGQLQQQYNTSNSTFITTLEQFSSAAEIVPLQQQIYTVLTTFKQPQHDLEIEFEDICTVFTAESEKLDLWQVVIGHFFFEQSKNIIDKHLSSCLKFDIGSNTELK